jgi:hypothetical protein
LFKRILIGLAIMVVAFLGIVALQPADYRVTRGISINAPAEVVFAQVNDFRKWEAWSPWVKLDPEVKNTFEGPATGTGAVFIWSGNADVGEGRMTLTESRPNDRIRIKLDFIRPFPDTCTVEFAFQPAGNQTAVTWSMWGHKNFIGKAACLFMNMDKMLGGDFEKGLAQMQTVAEAGAKSEQ